MLCISLKPGFVRGLVIVAASLAAVLVGLLSSGGSASALPAGRAYEMVSPVYKQGYGVTKVLAVSPSGESVAFTAQGGFAGALSGGINAHHDYLARRGGSGWSTGSFEPPFGGLSDVSANLEYGLAAVPVGPNAGVEDGSSVEQEFQLHDSAVPDTPESWGVFGGIVLRQTEGLQFSASEEGASSDLCHVVIGAERALLPEGKEGGPVSLYDLSRGCAGSEPYLRLIGLNNGDPRRIITPGCQVDLGTGQYVQSPQGLEQAAGLNAVDANGGEIFFTTQVEEGTKSNGCSQDGQLFVSVGGVKTVEVSRSLEGGPFGGCVRGGVPGEVPCDGSSGRAGAYFKGASEDGSRVFFTTRAPLVSGDEDAGNDLYMASIGCPASEPGCEAAEREVTGLVQVSHDPVAGQAAEVQGVVSVARDGSRVYFVARGVLTSEGATGEGVQSLPVAGADNLYVYDSVSGQTAFVADLCSGPGRSGVMEDVHCPRALAEGGGDAQLLWGGLGRAYPEAQSTPDGAFLVFAAYAQLTRDDTDSAKDVYRYDALTGGLERVSVSEDDYDADGNNNAFGADIALPSSWSGRSFVYEDYELASRAISEDGSRIVFSTADPLSPSATNGRVNVYEWDEGSVSLISTGTSEENDDEATISPSGEDIFFLTSQGLVSGDTDGLPDIYDAHKCTVRAPCFSPAPAEREPCEGDGCQGPLTNPAPLLVPGSVSQEAGGNFAAPAPAPSVKKRVKVKKKSKKVHAKVRGRALKAYGDRRVK